MSRAILILNSGSSSLKASLFRADGTRRDWRHAGIDAGAGGHAEAFEALLADLGADRPDAVGHRFVHGGDAAEPARLLDPAEIGRLRGLAGLAPLHMPANLLGVELCRARLDVPQVACFDTAFHHAMPDLARRLPIPPTPGLRRYGFHGISYAHVAARLPGLLGEAAQGRVVVAHLGAGASLCLLQGLKSMDTTMGYTPAGGIPMATRSGDLDPGVMLALARRHDAAALADLVNHGMGLLALSDGESGDMRALLASGSAGARFAVEYFCYQLRAAIGAMAARAGGIDALVFTGGIGENAPEIRARVCAPLGFLGLVLDEAANGANAMRISAAGSRPVLRLPADEEVAMRDLVTALLAGPTRP